MVTATAPIDLTLSSWRLAGSPPVDNQEHVTRQETPPPARHEHGDQHQHGDTVNPWQRITVATLAGQSQGRSLQAPQAAALA